MDAGTHYFHLAIDVAERKGLSVKALCQAAGIEFDKITDPELTVSSDEISMVWRHLCVELEDEFLGFTENPCKMGTFFTACKLAMYAPNLSCLFKEVARIYALTDSDISIALEPHKDGQALAVLNHATQVDGNHFITEFVLFNWHRLACWFTDKKIKPLYAEFSYSEPRHSEIYEVLFQCPIYFNCDKDALIFDEEIKKIEPVRRRKELHEFLNSLPVCHFPIPGKDNSIESRVKNLIVKCSDKKLVLPSLQEVAHNLHMSRTSLSRKLNNEQTSYRRLKEFIRRELVEEKLIRTSMTVTEISAFAGFSETASLNRAFKRWTGITPRQFRLKFQD